ncbi:hypothetical protein [Flavilitoribacter nigricans]|uniref:Uncharacterized protein n=1 Tax=Flavilitoribacter nigricans (strain ATCC 23147 / DSM 23189 / NBRC 102662 / NCIMB 1420 / SS-2) TaxID=1122177 RepID=A0A2D0NAL0_FLAN2|nr:hypothetical protein [Flavilitoribacter nigricans]PHN05517.1 hypothetical protein CRP01_16100 [Flavilitoribacter nigricans DSM 23189 = NBRC 102662]
MKQIVQNTLLTTFFLLPILVGAQPKPTCAELEGVWEYDLPDQRGIWFSHNDHYMWILVPKERASFQADNPTTEEMAMAYDGLILSVGNVKCSENRGTITHTYTKDPADAGQSFQFDYRVQGKQQQYWVLQADGSRGPEGRSRKLGTFATSSKMSCEISDGFWQYEQPDQYGIAAIADGHFGWILVDKTFWDHPTDLSTPENKATAFAAITAAAGTFSCDEPSIIKWKNLHTKNYRGEGVSFPTENQQSPDRLEFWFLNQQGERTGGGGKAVRMKD